MEKLKKGNKMKRGLDYCDHFSIILSCRSLPFEKILSFKKHPFPYCIQFDFNKTDRSENLHTQ